MTNERIYYIVFFNIVYTLLSLASGMQAAFGNWPLAAVLMAAALYVANQFARHVVTMLEPHAVFALIPDAAERNLPLIVQGIVLTSAVASGGVAYLATQLLS